MLHQPINYNSMNNWNLEEVVKSKFQSIINTYGFEILNLGPDIVLLQSPACCIRICYGQAEQTSGTKSLTVHYFSPNDPGTEYGSLDLLIFRKESREIRNLYARYMRDNNIPPTDHSLDLALEFQAKHAEKFRTDILSGDFSSWKSSYLKNKYGEVAS